jgi:hypothetical protein
MSDTPDLAQEIDRKAITELQRVMHGLTTRRIGVVSAAASLQTLWETTAGLVAPETMTLIGESATGVQKALNSKARPEEVAVLVGSSNIAVVQRFSDRVIVLMQPAQASSVGQGRTLAVPIEESNPSLWCVDKFKAVCTQLGVSMSRVL